MQMTCAKKIYLLEGCIVALCLWETRRYLRATTKVFLTPVVTLNFQALIKQLLHTEDELIFSSSRKSEGKNTKRSHKSNGYEVKHGLARLCLTFLPLLPMLFYVGWDMHYFMLRCLIDSLTLLSFARQCCSKSMVSSAIVLRHATLLFRNIFGHARRKFIIILVRLVTQKYQLLRNKFNP